MDKLKSDINGGFPFTLDDLRWAEQSVRNAFTHFWYAFATNPTDSFVLQGCTMPDTDPGTTVSAGYIWLYGEICRVESHTIPSGVGQVYWDFVVTYDATGNKTFADSSTHDTYEIRKAKVYRGSVSPGTKLLASASQATIHDKIVKNSPRQRAIIEIGTWNMNTTQDKTVAHGLDLSDKIILDHKVYVFEDSDLTTRVARTPFETYKYQASVTRISASNIYLTRENGSPFDSTLYESTAESRGYIVLFFEPLNPNY